MVCVWCAGGSMDGSRFDSLVKTLSTPSTRRGALGGLLAGTLGLLGMTEATARRKTARGGGVTTERCLAIGEKCPKRVKHGQRKVRHTCDGANNTPACCTRYAETGADGQQRCACLPDGAACTQESMRHCC